VVTIDPGQWDSMMDTLSSIAYYNLNMQTRLQALKDYVSNGFVFVVWGTLALLFIMAIAFYFMFRHPRR